MWLGLCWLREIEIAFVKSNDKIFTEIWVNFSLSHLCSLFFPIFVVFLIFLQMKVIMQLRLQIIPFYKAEIA